MFLVERISFSVQNQLHLPLQSTVPFSSPPSPVLRRRAGLKIRCHRIALTNILPSSLLCPPEGVFNFPKISECLVYFIRWYILPSCDGHFQSLKTSLVLL